MSIPLVLSGLLIGFIAVTLGGGGGLYVGPRVPPPTRRRAARVGSDTIPCPEPAGRRGARQRVKL
jgi:hypothetical protein